MASKTLVVSRDCKTRIDATIIDSAICSSVPIHCLDPSRGARVRVCVRNSVDKILKYVLQTMRLHRVRTMCRSIAAILEFMYISKLCMTSCTSGVLKFIAVANGLICYLEA